MASVAEFGVDSLSQAVVRAGDEQNVHGGLLPIGEPAGWGT
jgi:hypothetical protein